MKQKTALNKAHKIWFTSIVDWDRPIRNWLFTGEHKTNIGHDSWQNEFAIPQHLVRILRQPTVSGLSFPSPRLPFCRCADFRLPQHTCFGSWFFISALPGGFLVMNRFKATGYFTSPTFYGGNVFKLYFEYLNSIFCFILV